MSKFLLSPGMASSFDGQLFGNGGREKPAAIDKYVATGDTTDDCFSMLRSSQMTEKQHIDDSPPPAMYGDVDNIVQDYNDNWPALASSSPFGAKMTALPLSPHESSHSSSDHSSFEVKDTPSPFVAPSTPMPRRSSSSEDSNISTPQALKMMQGEPVTPSPNKILGELFSPESPAFGHDLGLLLETQAPCGVQKVAEAQASSTSSRRRARKLRLFASPPSTRHRSSSQVSQTLVAVPSRAKGVHFAHASSDIDHGRDQGEASQGQVLAKMQTNNDFHSLLPSSSTQQPRTHVQTSQRQPAGAIAQSSPCHDKLLKSKSSDIPTSSLDDEYSAPPSPTLRAAAFPPLIASRVRTTSTLGPLPRQKKIFKGHAHVNHFDTSTLVAAVKRKLPLQLASSNKDLSLRPHHDTPSVVKEKQSTPEREVVLPPAPKKRRIIPRLAKQTCAPAETQSASVEARKDSKVGDKVAEETDAACILLSLGRSATRSQCEEVLASDATERTLRAVRRMSIPTSQTKGIATTSSRGKGTAAKKRREPYVAAAAKKGRVSSGGASMEATRYRDLPDHDKKHMRDFAPDLPVMLDKFPQWYRRFPVSSAVGEELHNKVFGDAETTHATTRHKEAWTRLTERGARKMGVWKEPDSPLDLYSARWMRGTGRDKEALCPICYEEGRTLYLKSKTSQYNYHLINQHGISPHTKKPIHPPVKFQTITMAKAALHERKVMLQGKCRACKGWVHLESVKEGDVKVPEIYWWKHASQCHKKLDGEREPRGVFVEDELFKQIEKVLGQT